MGKIIRRLSLVSSLTLLSRFLGLARDVLFFGCFGASLLGEAFILAFTFPNLFRRMLGEGTLSSAFIPVFAETLRAKSKERALALLNQVTSRLFIFLGGGSLLIAIFSYYASFSGFFEEAKWIEGAYLNSITFGYVVFICTSAILVGALNSTGRFFEGAFSPVILNFFMISAMITGKFFLNCNLLELAVFLSLSVVIAGLVQLALPWHKLRTSMNWKWKMTITGSDEMDQIKSLFWVGALGAAVGQINILVSRFFAYSLDESGGLSYLFLSSRLVELPLGVFAIAITTVFFPEMAKAASGGERAKFIDSVYRGFRLTLGITIPAAAGLAFLAKPILIALFQWGEFGEGEVKAASEILMIASVGLPFYAISTFLVKVYHSKKKMILPFQAAIISLLANLGFSLLLIEEYQVHGLAWSNVFAAILQTIYLAIRMDEIPVSVFFLNQPIQIPSIIFSVGVMSGTLYFSNQEILNSYTKFGSVLYLLAIIPVGVIVYGLMLLILGFPELKGLFKRTVRHKGFKL